MRPEHGPREWKWCINYYETALRNKCRLPWKHRQRQCHLIFKMLSMFQTQFPFSFKTDNGKISRWRGDGAASTGGAKTCFPFTRAERSTSCLSRGEGVRGAAGGEADPGGEGKCRLESGGIGCSFPVPRGKGWGCAGQQV